MNISKLDLIGKVGNVCPFIDVSSVLCMDIHTICKFSKTQYVCECKSQAPAPQSRKE